MTPDSGILTTLLNTFTTAFTGGFGRIYGDAWSLLGILAALELTVAAVWWALTESDALKELLRLAIKVGFFIFVVTKYDWLIDKVLGGFISTGIKAGGAGNVGLMKDPSAIVDYGLFVTEPIFQHIQNYGAVDTLANLPDVIMTGLAGLLLLLAFFALGIQVFITYLEFYLVAVLGLILVPFGVFKYTSFITEKVFGAIISFGMRLMVLSFIVSVSRPVLANLSLPADPSLQKIMIMFLAVISIAILAWHAPGIAGGLLAGAPSLTAGSGLGVGAAAAVGLAGGGLAAKQAVKETASTAVGATKAAAHGLGAASAVGQAGGTAGGTTQAAKNLVSSAATAVTSGIKDSFSAGRIRAFKAMGAENATSAGAARGASTDTGSSATVNTGTTTTAGGSSSSNPGASAPRSTTTAAAGSTPESGSSTGSAGGATAGGASTETGSSTSVNTGTAPGAAGSSTTSPGSSTSQSTTAAASGSAPESGSSTSSATGSAAAGAPNSPTNQQHKPDWFSKMQQAKATVPAEATPTGNLSAPIPDKDK